MVGCDLLTTESPWRDGGGFSPLQLVDRVVDVLPGQHIFPFQPLPQRGDRSPGGEGEVVEGDEVVGVRRMGRQAASQ